MPEVSIPEWLQSHQRPDFKPEHPIAGFGPHGKHTLYLPASAPQILTEFRDGKAVRREVGKGPATTDPELIAIRNKVLRSIADDSAGFFTVDVDLLNYTARLIRFNYTFTDDELNLLLAQRGGWHRGVIRHIVGGDGIVDAIAANAPALHAYCVQRCDQVDTLAPTADLTVVVDRAATREINNQPKGGFFNKLLRMIGVRP